MPTNERGANLYACRACGHRWISRTPRPQRCPHCNTRNWNKNQGTKKRCAGCGHEWQPRVAKPRRCPNCMAVLVYEDDGAT